MSLRSGGFCSVASTIVALGALQTQSGTGAPTLIAVTDGLLVTLVACFACRLG